MLSAGVLRVCDASAELRVHAPARPREVTLLALRGGEQLVETKALMNPAQGNSLVQTYGWGADS